MKTLFLKNVMPAATAVLAIAGAFATTSMQSASSAYQLKIGYALGDGSCDIAVMCSTIPSSQICRYSYPIGDPAFEIVPATGTCLKVLYRPL